MKFMRDLSIRKKLFAAILVILLINFLLLILLGSTLFQSFYERSKINELQKSADDLSRLYTENSQQSWDALYSQIFTAENRNSTVMIFQLGEEAAGLEVVYHSRMRTAELVTDSITLTPAVPTEESAKEDKCNGDEGKGDETAQTIPGGKYVKMVRLNTFPPPDATALFDVEVIKSLPTGGGQIILQDEQENHGDRERGGGRITLMSQLDDNLYLMMETPKEYIKSTADLAVLYSAVISIAILFAGALAIYYLSGRFTKPIREIDAVAKQIALMDFSRSCTVHSKDEIGTLAASVNHMSAELSGNMDKLITANAVLTEDLARQQETDRIRRQFISDVSHDFKTPLTLIVSYAEALRDMQQQEQSQDFCDIIADEGNRLSLMVGRLLKLSRLESGMETVEESVFCLSEILDDAIRCQRLPAEKKRLRLLRDYCGETVVRADYQKIEQVVLNLLENAVKYTPEGMEIEVSVLTEGEQCRVVVANEGSHIDESELESIFISFYRADKSRERACQSYGLGLAIVKTIMELHRLPFGAENTDSGVRFWFQLPVVPL